MTQFPLSLAHSLKPDQLAAYQNDRYTMEPKLDGVRLRMEIRADGIRLFTRSEHIADGKLPAVERFLAPSLDSLVGTVIDGEGVYLDPATGAADFNWTMRCLGSGADVARQKQTTTGKYVSFVAFDILQVGDQDARQLPFRVRRELLQTLVDGLACEYLVLTEQRPVTTANHLEFTERYGEGSMVKDLEAPYIGKRSKAILKWKKVLDEDVVVMGREDGKGKYEGQLGAIVFGQYRDGVLVERGRCSGMDDATRRRLSSALPLGSVMVVTHNGHMKDGFRHPQFSHFRTDKAPEQCEWTEAPR